MTKNFEQICCVSCNENAIVSKTFINVITK